MTEAELQEVNGLVARFYATINGAPRYSYDERFDLQRRLLILNVQLERPLPTPDPTAPPGGTSMAKVA